MNAPPLLRLLLLGLALGLPGVALAASYRVDLIVFLDQNYQQGAPDEGGAPATLPDTSRAIDIEDEIGLQVAGIQLVDEADSQLSEAWSRLRNSRRFKPLLHLSWVQRDPPPTHGPSLRVHTGDLYTLGDPLTPDGAQQIEALDGTLTLLLNRYLHLDVDLQYAQREVGGVVGYHLRDSRRMRSGELHHLDSPRFGMLAKITPADADAAND